MAHLTTPSGTTARFLTDFPSAQGVWGFAVSVQSDGKVVAGGQWAGAIPPGWASPGTKRTGRMDDSFGGDGKVTTNFTSGLDRIYGVSIQADGNVVAAGRAEGRGVQFALARYLGS